MFTLESSTSCDPNEIRTRVWSLKGSRPRPLDDGTMATRASLSFFWPARAFRAVADR